MATSKFYKRKQFLLLSTEEVKQFVTILRYAYHVFMYYGSSVNMLLA